MLDCPKTEGSSDGVRDSLKMAVEVVAKLKEEKHIEKLEKLFEIALKKYPNISKELESSRSDLKLKLTWSDAWVWIKKGGHGKERFNQGRIIFEKILTMKMDDYWALFFMVNKIFFLFSFSNFF